MIRYSGGIIIIIWRAQLMLTKPIAVSHNVLHLIISIGNAFNWILSVVYNPTRIQGLYVTWLELSGMSSLNLPWFLIGDFNALVDLNEHKVGNNSY